MVKKKTREKESYSYNIKKSTIYFLLAGSYQIDPRVKQEVNTLSNNNYNVFVLSWDREGKNRDIISENLYVKSLKLLTANKFKKLIFLLSAILFQFSIIIYGMKLIKKRSHLIIHANDINTLPGALMLKSFFSKRIQVVYDSHELTPAIYSEWYGNYVGSVMGKIEKFLLNYVDEVITVSPPLVKYLTPISHQKVNLIWNFPSKIIIPNISKQQARSNLNLSNEKFIITYVGTLRHDIALMDLIDAIDILKNRFSNDGIIEKFQVNIIGDGPLYIKLKDSIRKKSLQNIINIAGRVDRDISLTHLKAADLSYVLFTIKGLNTYIGMPWKLFESLVCGTKVLVAEKTYVANFINKFQAGYTVKHITSEEIANTIYDIYKSNKGDELQIKDNFLWENQEKQFIAIYDSLLKRQKQ